MTRHDRQTDNRAIKRTDKRTTKRTYGRKDKPTTNERTDLPDDVRESIPLLAVLHNLLGIDRALLERLVVVGGQVEVLEALGGVGLVVPGDLFVAADRGTGRKD